MSHVDRDPIANCYDCERLLAACTCAKGPTSHTTGDEIACPWCGALIKDLREVGDGGEGEHEIDCGTCEGPIELSTSVTYTRKARRSA